MDQSKMGLNPYFAGYRKVIQFECPSLKILLIPNYVQDFGRAPESSATSVLWQIHCCPAGHQTQRGGLLAPLSIRVIEAEIRLKVQFGKLCDPENKC